MDTSEIYIKMCEKTEEIQKAKPPYGEQWFREFYTYYPEDQLVWLPRQDQLQEMLLNEEIDTICLALNFYDWVKAGLWANAEYSMEQLWLAFVMKEKHNKVWNGQEWITDGKV